MQNKPKLEPCPRTAQGLMLALAAGLGLALTAPDRAAAQQVTITPMVTGLDEPWGMAFLPGGAVLITERGGRLLLVPATGAVSATVAGVPPVAVGGQGGLLDVMVPRDFAQSRQVWLSYAARADSGGVGTAAGFGRLSEDGSQLEGFKVVHPPMGQRGGRHFGARLVEARDGTVYLTTGDRGQGGLAQNPGRAEGKVLAFDAQGNPRTAAAFAGQAGVVAGLHSLGHRNIQGAALDAQGQLWTVEHGAQGGDEVNRIAPARNYGWPVISFGVDYGGGKLGIGTAQDGMEQPLHHWDPSIAPSGLVVYSGRLFGDWTGHLLTGSLNSGFISRLDPKAQAATGYAEARIETPETGRVRDIVEAPDGAIWFLSVEIGRAHV